MDSNNASNSETLSATLSQSGATTSFLLANTLSKPLPQLTRSLEGGSVKTSTTSLPSPAESLSVAKSPSGPSATRSLPSSPNMLSEPTPPRSTSLPLPPTMFLSPPERRRSEPPKTKSLPEPPSRLSLPPKLRRTSLPPLPRRLSAPLVPLKVSGPSVPILLTAQATPLASSKAKAIATSTSTTRRILFAPFLEAGVTLRHHTSPCEVGSIHP